VGQEAIARFADEIEGRTGYRAVYLGARTIREHDLIVHVYKLREHPLHSYAYAWGEPGCTVIVRPPPMDAEAAVQDAMQD
jgi:hypothetical protein